ncbi:MAG: hypothetical protein JWM30_1467 [Burkholderia sp.]|nr:hypothetical protein [Burkholderia sp.]
MSDGFQASPYYSKLAATPRRIEFVILRTANSPPIALHPASRQRSYLRLQGFGLPWQGLSPCWLCAFADALQSVRSADRHRRGRLFCPTFLAEQKSGSAAGTNTRLRPPAVSEPRFIRPADAEMAPCFGAVQPRCNRNCNGRCAERQGQRPAIDTGDPSIRLLRSLLRANGAERTQRGTATATVAARATATVAARATATVAARATATANLACAVRFPSFRKREENQSPHPGQPASQSSGTTADNRAARWAAQPGPLPCAPPVPRRIQAS